MSLDYSANKFAVTGANKFANTFHLKMTHRIRTPQYIEEKTQLFHV
jgi:hypothetical protein